MTCYIDKIVKKKYKVMKNDENKLFLNHLKDFEGISVCKCFVFKVKVIKTKSTFLPKSFDIQIHAAAAKCRSELDCKKHTEESKKQ